MRLGRAVIAIGFLLLLSGVCEAGNCVFTVQGGRTCLNGQEFLRDNYGPYKPPAPLQKP